MKSSPNHKKEFVFGSFVYHYDLVKQERKTLSLTVMPDLDIILKCPHSAENERIELFLKKKWFWLEKQLSFFKRYQRKIYHKEYVSGEGFLYLGRQYKLLVKKSKEDKVKLTKGLLEIHTTKGLRDGYHTKRLLSAWYDSQRVRMFQDRLEYIVSNFDNISTPRLSIREMKRRWGSFLSDGTIILNQNLIHTPRECIDYVITHELCHMTHRSHNKNFYKLLKKQCPQWMKAKDRLETIGANITSI